MVLISLVTLRPDNARAFTAAAMAQRDPFSDTPYEIGSGQSNDEKKLIAANWKMYKTPDQTRDFFRDFLPLVAGHDRDEIVVCPPYID